MTKSADYRYNNRTRKEVRAMAASQQKERKKENLKKVFQIMREVKNLEIVRFKGHFNNTEMRLINEVLEADYEGQRLISTQLAKRLGVTRSAVSQIVNKLEKQGVIVRTADEVDRKIAYIELSDTSAKAYQTELKYCLDFVDKTVEKFGEEKLKKLCDLSSEFLALVEETKKEMK